MQNSKMDTSDLNQSHQQPIQFLRQQSKQEIQQNNEIEKKNKILQQNIRDAQRTHGVIEICFVLDCTQSMDTHIKNAIACIEMAIKLIKEQTNRECRWAAVAYKDVDYLNSYKVQQYPQMDFVDNHLEVMQFINSQKCQGGVDIAEDLQLAFKQAANLGWENHYRIIMLVTDAPCHGKQYSNNVCDELPDRTIEAELDLLLIQKIYLICINLPPQLKGQVYTEKMFKYFKQYYDQKGFGNHIKVVECQNMKYNDLKFTFTQSLSQATLQITQVLDPNTSIKRQSKQATKDMLGAVEALYKKLPDPTNFDTFNGITVKCCKFVVYRCEFKPAVIQSNIQQIWNVGNTKNDYEFAKQNNPWECIRTETHFAEGQMKKVYLMKKVERPQEVYVIKAPITGSPYQSFQEAYKECRSHLVAKIFMKKFRDLCFEQKSEKNIQLEIPPIQYSDFLILEEEGKSAWWIAERFFKGEFVKYNNNNGYIRDTQDLFNQFSQAFTIFTYFQSEGTMMICDVQGMGQYFTDPAINTKKGGFDDTDIGLNGIKNYLVNYVGKCLGKEYLELLNIKINT